MRGRLSFRIGPLSISIPLKVLIPVVVVVLILAVVGKCSDVFAAESTTNDNKDAPIVLPSQCVDGEHEWKFVNFDTDTMAISLKCINCDETMTTYFIDLVTSDTYIPCLDFNNDKTLNAFDYALMFKYHSNLLDRDIFDLYSSKKFLYKETFSYVYQTILTVVSTGCICLVLRRNKKC